MFSIMINLRPAEITAATNYTHNRNHVTVVILAPNPDVNACYTSWTITMARNLANLVFVTVRVIHRY